MKLVALYEISFAYRGTMQVCALSIEDALWWAKEECPRETITRIVQGDLVYATPEALKYGKEKGRWP